MGVFSATSVTSSHPSIFLVMMLYAMESLILNQLSLLPCRIDNLTSMRVGMPSFYQELLFQDQ